MAKSLALQVGMVEPVVEQAEPQPDHRIAALHALDVLRGLPNDELQRLAEIAVLRVFHEGSAIVTEHTTGEHMFVVLHGLTRITLHDKDGHEVLLGLLGRGDIFGEGLLFGDHFRRTSVSTEMACTVLQLPISELRDLLDQVPATAATLRSIYRGRLIESALGRVPLFSSLLPLERSQLAHLLRPSSFARGTEILRQGEPGTALFLIEDGQVVIEQAGQVIAHLDEGDFFGEMSLLYQQPHNATVRALTPVQVLCLPAEQFYELLEQQPALAEQLQAAVDSRTHAGNRMRNDRALAERLDLAVRRGLLRGSHLFVRDTTLCPPDCHLCEQGCATRHGRSRLHIGGVMVDQFDVVNSCHQCRFGAECVEACPEDAIRWDNHGALVISDRCTGCGDCAPACPYGAIEITPTKQASTPLWRLWNNLTRRTIIPLEAAGPTRQATKCDRCHGYDDLACISACPTGALRLVPVEEILPL